jgi:hypothetical protein
MFSSSLNAVVSCTTRAATIENKKREQATSESRNHSKGCRSKRPATPRVQNIFNIFRADDVAELSILLRTTDSGSGRTLRKRPDWKGQGH